MRMLTGIVALVALAGCAKPSKIEVTGVLPVNITELVPLSLPKAIIRDQDGNELPDAQPDISVAPPGLAEIKDGKLVPRAAGDVVVTWAIGNGKKVSQPLAIRPIDRVELRCVPSCRVAIGSVANVQATAYSGATPQLDVEVTLTSLSPDLLTVKDGKVIGKAKGDAKLEGRVGSLAVVENVEVRNVADGVDLRCPGIYTLTDVGDGTQLDVCYMTKGRSALMTAHAMAGPDAMPDERVSYDILNRQIADVGTDGTVVARAVGQTTMKAALSSNAFVYKQVSIYVDEPRALERFWRMRPRGMYWSYASGRVYEFYSPACKDWKNFYTRAFARVPEKPEPQGIRCQSSEAVACVAEAASALTRRGWASTENFRAWLGPCCCITDSDRDELEAQEKKLRGEK